MIITTTVLIMIIVVVTVVVIQISDIYDTAENAAVGQKSNFYCMFIYLRYQHIQDAAAKQEAA